MTFNQYKNALEAIKGFAKQISLAACEEQRRIIAKNHLIDCKSNILAQSLYDETINQKPPTEFINQILNK